MSGISDFFVGANKYFTGVVVVDKATKDISADTITLILKADKNDTDANAVLSFDADVATAGATGKAIFDLTPADTDLVPGQYYYEITWYPDAGGEYVLDQGQIRARSRVTDVN